MSELSEYAEKIVTDGFKRQLDQEENAVRSLPFIIAGASFVGTLLRMLHPKLCKFNPHGPFSILLYADAWLMAAAMIGILYGLFAMIRPHRYEYPMDELAFLQYVRDLDDDYGQTPNADEATFGRRPRNNHKTTGRIRAHQSATQPGKTVGTQPRSQQPGHLDNPGLRHDLRGVVATRLCSRSLSCVSLIRPFRHCGTKNRTLALGQNPNRRLILLCHKYLARFATDLSGMEILTRGGGLWVSGPVDAAANHGLLPMSR